MEIYLSSLFILLFIFSCDSDEPIQEPLIEPQFDVTVSGQSWRPNRGKALVLNDGDFGSIRLTMAGPNDGRGRIFRLVIESTDFDWLPISEYGVSSLEDRFTEKADYYESTSDGELQYRRSHNLNVAVIEISSITEIDGIEYLSGSFRASPCNGDLFPACVPIVGTFDSLRLFYDAVTF